MSARMRTQGQGGKEKPGGAISRQGLNLLVVTLAVRHGKSGFLPGGIEFRMTPAVRWLHA
jgi:hypothetical protein